MAQEKDKRDGKGSNKKGAKKKEGKTREGPELDSEIARKVALVRAHVRESFGNVAMAMMLLPRYKHQTLSDLQHLLLDPLLRDRVAIAYPTQLKSGETHNHLADIAGMAIWASVSEDVDGKIRDQIKAGIFPLRLKGDDWTSGDINWLIDIIAPDRKATANVIANFRQVIKEGSLRLHPIVTRLVDPEVLEEMGAQKFADPS